MPSVVNIYTSKEIRQRQPLVDDPILRRFFPGLEEGEPRRATSLGSGVIVSSEGYVLTNNHVVEDADDIQLVLADGRRMRARRARQRSRSPISRCSRSTARTCR